MIILEKACAIAEPKGFIRIFVDLGQPDAQTYFSKPANTILLQTMCSHLLTAILQKTNP